MTTIIKGQPTSEEVRQYLAEQNKPVILACSLGKDSLAAWCALEKDGIEVVPVYFWSVPNLSFVQDNIKEIEKVFNKKNKPSSASSFFQNACTSCRPTAAKIEHNSICGDWSA